jgi:alkanesulfonate monooxygenase SsuD/methylene tetrahydromethanopterin reductase-like flavin-dependent oxidoreductase (luciferase family)
MIGSNGPRMLSIALPHAAAWNTWWTDFGNRAEGFADLNERISAAARDAGRDPADIARSACVLVRLDGAALERPDDPDAPAVTGSHERIAAELRAIGQAGADEVILIADPITESSIRELAEVVALV